MTEPSVTHISCGEAGFSAALANLAAEFAHEPATS